jgi:hypothetical protein
MELKIQRKNPGSASRTRDRAVNSGLCQVGMP